MTSTFQKPYPDAGHDLEILFDRKTSNRCKTRLALNRPRRKTWSLERSDYAKLTGQVMTYTIAAARHAASQNPKVALPKDVEAVLQNTWGHLSPEVRQPYSGFVLFTRGVYGDITVIDWDLRLQNGNELESSPWFYEDLHDKVAGWIEAKGSRPGGIWRFEGTFERLKNGKSRWRGKVRSMRVKHRFAGRS